MRTLKAFALATLAGLAMAGAVSAATPIKPGATPFGGWAAWDEANFPEGFQARNGGATRVIMNWNTVPFQTTSRPLRIRVGAFHEPTDAEYRRGLKDNIQKVGVSCDNGPIAWATAPSGPHGEYEFDFLPSAVGHDGPVECRAVGVPLTGLPRVQQGLAKAAGSSWSLVVNANAGGGLPGALRYVSARGGADVDGCGKSARAACLTISKAKEEIHATGVAGNWRARGSGTVGGGVICLMPGAYRWGAVDEPAARDSGYRWLLVQPCEGVMRDQVVLNEYTDVNANFKAGMSNFGATARSSRPAGLRVTRVHVRNIFVKHVIFWAMPNSGYIWLEDVVSVGPGVVPHANQYAVSKNFQGHYYTRVDASNMYQAFPAATLVQDSVAHQIYGDVLVNNRNVWGLQVYRNGAAAGSHPDLFQWGNRANLFNGTLVDVTAKDDVRTQQIFGGEKAVAMTDYAFIGWDLDNQSPGPGTTGRQIALFGTLDHVIFRGNTFGKGTKDFSRGAYKEAHFIDNTCIGDRTFGLPEGADYKIRGGNCAR